MTTATQIQLRRGTAAQVGVFTPAAGELVADMTNFRTVLGDGATVGGRPQASEAYVQTQIASFTAGQAANFVSWLYQI